MWVCGRLGWGCEDVHVAGRFATRADRKPCMGHHARAFLSAALSMHPHPPLPLPPRTLKAPRISFARQAPTHTWRAVLLPVTLR
eukprot:352159-Chlamydomonas_euryale.AAC.13